MNQHFLVLVLTYSFLCCRYPYRPNGVPDDPYEVRPDDKYYPGRARPPVSPRSPRRLSPPRSAERPARRDLSPGMPRSPRGGSPRPRSRELSPVRYQPAIGPPTGRAMSPPPELHNSYFPNKGLPNYLESDSDPYNTGGAVFHRLPSRDDNRGGRSGGPKYTASSLGLTDRGPGANIMRNPSARDEGYRSMDLQERPPSGGQYYDSPYVQGPVHSMPNMYPDRDRGYKARDKPRRAYDEMPPPDYALRGGGGFDYLP